MDENDKKSVMDFLFFGDLGLPFSCAVFSFRGDFNRKVSKNRDFLRVGDDNPSTDLRADECKLLAAGSSILTRWFSSRVSVVYVRGVRGQYANSVAIAAAWLDNAGSILIFVSVSHNG